MKTLICDHIHEDAMVYAKDNLDIVSPSEIRDIDYEDAEAVIVRIFPMSRENIDRMPKLKIIAKHGVGVDNIDLEYAASKGILVTNTPLANVNSVAELAVALTLACARKITMSNNSIKKGLNQVAPFSLTGYELNNRVLGLVGLGRIGLSIAQKLKNGFNMQVAVYDPYASKEICEKEGFTKYETLEELLTLSDVVNISVPLTKETENLISAQELSKMKKNAILINTSRGRIIDEQALLASLKEGHLFGAAIDAFAEEPVNRDNPLLSCDNFIGTPHNGANTEDALIRMGKGAVNEVVRYIKNQEPFSKLV
ncbi:hypothetical protein CHI12_10545 [Terribacillus saccharophilus]|uniref:D-3-phosphoglycerate dehydrogenase n=1 Tax=Terribacillus saccharophilus TaxID=361277 RepID=A0A268HCK5_9BACI|nr:hydroxyacid dehydrogenase [Terribacillus saccharophilus]PAE07595.1 hypothetical protein CHI12_10545 [Terribacillus saccharophilus]